MSNKSKYKRYNELTKEDMAQIRNDVVEVGDRDQAARMNGTTRIVVDMVMRCEFA